MNNYGDSQKLVLVEVQNNEKMSFGILSNNWCAATQLTYKQCMNMYESCLNTS